MYSQWIGGLLVVRLSAGKGVFTSPSWDAPANSLNGEILLVAFLRSNEEDASIMKAMTEVV